MKQCVKCRQLFGDENLRFCRFDGTSLISEVPPADEAVTALFTTGQLKNLYPPLEDLRRSTNSGKLYE